MSFETVDLAIVGPALIAGLLVLATHVPLGVQVLARGIVFIDLAVAQVAGLGVIAAHLAGWEAHGIAVQAAALSAALAAALVLTWTEKRFPDVQEALIGTMFVLAATGATLALAGNPHGAEHLKDLLVGQILWVTNGQLAAVAVVTALVLALWFGTGRRLGRPGFYLLFAVSVTASVQLVGIYLVFASLIVPALAVRTYGRARLAAGYAVGAGAYAAGLAVSAITDLPPGPMIVWALALAAVPVSLVRTSRRREGTAAGT
jgi:zinc/manganese transport system permease protein